MRMCVHKGVPHGSPMVEPMIQIADPCLFLVVAQAQGWIPGCDRRFDCCPLPLTVLIFGKARLKTSLIFIRARVPCILIAICLGKKESQADAACGFGGRRIEALGSCNDDCQVDNVLERSV